MSKNINYRGYQIVITNNYWCPGEMRAMWRGHEKELEANDVTISVKKNGHTLKSWNHKSISKTEKFVQLATGFIDEKLNVTFNRRIGKFLK